MKRKIENRRKDRKTMYKMGLNGIAESRKATNTIKRWMKK